MHLPARNPLRKLTKQCLIQDQVFARRGVAGSSSTVAPASSWIPLTDGAEPPGFITDGAGHLILVAYP